MPNALTASRIAAAAFMLLAPGTPCFWAFYTWCGISDMADGALARRLVSLHTFANKATGLVVFLCIPTTVFTGNPLCAVPACAIATFAAIQEGHLVRTGDLT